MDYEKLYEGYNEMYWWVRGSLQQYKLTSAPLLTRIFTETKHVSCHKSDEELNKELQDILVNVSDVVIKIGNKLLSEPQRFSTGYNYMISKNKEGCVIENPYKDCEGIIDLDTEYEFVFDIGGLEGGHLLQLRNSLGLNDLEVNLLSGIFSWWYLHNRQRCEIKQKDVNTELDKLTDLYKDL